MPSRSGGMLAEKFSAVLMRKLTVDEVVLCEELALNFFIAPLLAYIDRESRKPLKHTFEILYMAMARGVIKGGKRSIRRIDLCGPLLEAFKKLDLYNPGMSDTDAQTVVALVDRFSSAEIDRGIVLARRRGVRSVRYVLGVCVGNAGKPVEREKKPIKVFDDDIIRPNPEDVAGAWARMIESADTLTSRNDAERAANDEISKR